MNSHLLRAVFLTPLFAATLAASDYQWLDEPSPREQTMFDIPVHVFRHTASNGVIRESRVLNSKGQLFLQGSVTVLKPDTVPAECFDHILVSDVVHDALNELGAATLENFEFDSAPRYEINGVRYRDVWVTEDPTIDIGRVVNLSTRGYLRPGNPVIGGFVVTDESKFLLIRAIGPGLRKYGVSGAANDPRVLLRKEQLVVDRNDNWSDREDTYATLLVSEYVGAFPLDGGSGDAAFVTMVEPGAYTAEVSTADGGSGEILLEIYVVE